MAELQPDNVKLLQNCKRDDYLEWPEYFMALAFLSAQRSKDPASQIGACIINEDKKIVGIGYNGMPNGCNDEIMPWGKTDSDPMNNKYLYVCHAEMNAILNKNSSNLFGCTLYTTLYPCNECAKLIIQSGIKTVVYMSKKNKSQISYKAAEKLFEIAGIKCVQYVPKQRIITIDFDILDKNLNDSFIEDNK